MTKSKMLNINLFRGQMSLLGNFIETHGNEVFTAHDKNMFTRIAEKFNSAHHMGFNKSTRSG